MGVHLTGSSKIIMVSDPSLVDFLSFLNPHIFRMVLPHQSISVRGISSGRPRMGELFLSPHCSWSFLL